MNDEKYLRLCDEIKKTGRLAVAFSGGVDSVFLLKTAHDLLGENAVAVSVESMFFPEREKKEARAFCLAEGIRQVIINIEEMEFSPVADNPPDRCYICKRMMFERMLAAAAGEGIDHVCDGTNADDMPAERPGMRALLELGIKSPLRDAGLSKADIRRLSKDLGLETWDKPSYACLASRVACGERLTGEKLFRTEQAEEVLHGLGIMACRVRNHRDMARIEVCGQDMDAVYKNRGDICRNLKKLGYKFVALDLGGYKSGSMNG